MSGPLSVDIFRGKTLESTHVVEAVVMDASGKIVASFGQANRLVFPRSAIKKAQALSLMESGAAEKFGLSQKWIALACASHLGEKIHTNEVQTWLGKIGLAVSDFECGPQSPYDEAAEHEMIRKEEKPTSLHNNCSGKHCGMLTTAIHMNEKPKGYSKYDHPIQVRLRRILSDLSGVNYDLAPWGTDGCGIPTYAIPLDKLAQTMSVFLPESPLAKSSDLRRQATQKILAAVTAEPEMISGTQGLCSRVIRESKGRAIAKTGAEGVYVGLTPSQGISIALKTQDGASRAAELSILHLLQKYQGLTEWEANQIKPLTTAILKNWSGDVVGSTSIRDS